MLSPICAQGFVLGRGNLQLSPAALRRIGTRDMIVAATPAKLARTQVLRFDTGDVTGLACTSSSAKARSRARPSGCST